MKEITKVIKVYEFDELSEAAKEKACQQVGDSMTDNEVWWYEDIFDLFVERCKDYGMEVYGYDIHFDDFWSQGGGASFVCGNIDRKKLLHTLGIQVSDELEEKVLDYIYEVNITRTSYQAANEQTIHAELFVDEDALEEEDEGIIQYIHDIADTLEFKLEKLKDDLCQQLYNDLEQQYDYLHSTVYVEELAHDNEMLFLADGTIYDWGE